MRQFASQPLLLSKIHHHRKCHLQATEDPWHFLTHPEKIIGFFPDNKAGRGSGMTVLLSEGKDLWIPATMNTLLNRLADHYLINMSSMKKRLQLRLGMAYYLPLPFSHELVLIQVKTRLSAPENEGVHGYVNACRVKSSLVCDETKENKDSKRNMGGIESTDSQKSTGGNRGEIPGVVGVKEKTAGYGRNHPSDGLPYLEMECGLRFPCLTSQKKVNARFLQAQVGMDEVLEKKWLNGKNE